MKADGAEIQDPGRNASRRQHRETDGHEAGRIAMGEDDNNNGVSSLLPSVVWHWRDGEKHQLNATAVEENMRAKPFCSKKEQEHCKQADKKISPSGGMDTSKKLFGAKEPKQGEQADKVAVVQIDVPKDMK